MAEHLKKDRNTPLETVLQEHTSIEKGHEIKSAHYTLVHLDRVRKDAQAYLEIGALKDYLRRTAPLRMDPEFKYAGDIERRLQKFVPGYLAIDVRLNADPLYKPFLEPCEAPQDRQVFGTDSSLQPIAYCWFCANSEGGQFKGKQSDDAEDAENRHPNSGLVFRVKNISIGDRFLARTTFWRKSPERSFHYFGEIHVIDTNVVPSSDRTDFEDSEARGVLYKQSAKDVARDLNLIREAESEARNFDKKIAQAQAVFSGNREKLANKSMAVEVREDHAYDIKKTLEDLKKRLERSKNEETKSEARQVVKQGERLLAQLADTGDKTGGFVNITQELQWNKNMAAMYQVIIDTLRDELNYDSDRFERLVSKIHEALRAARV